jgi:hypothetical protein
MVPAASWQIDDCWPKRINDLLTPAQQLTGNKRKSVAEPATHAGQGGGKGMLGKVD